MIFSASFYTSTALTTNMIKWLSALPNALSHLVSVIKQTVSAFFSNIIYHPYQNLIGTCLFCGIPVALILGAVFFFKRHRDRENASSAA